MRWRTNALWVGAILVAGYGSACEQDDINLGWRGDVLGPMNDGSIPLPRDGSTDASSPDSGEPPSDASPDTGVGDGSAVGIDAAVEPGVADAMTADVNTVPMGAGCGTEPPLAESSIQVDGMLGRFILDLPADYDSTRAYPLVMAFRGSVVTAEAFRDYLGLVPVAGADAILVHADCLGDASSWDLSRDLPYAEALLSKLESTYCIDAQRVYAVGHGTGSAMANNLGCVLGAKLRGIAPLSGELPPSGPCEGDDVAVWMAQGDRGGPPTAGDLNRSFWLDRNGCDAALTEEVEPAPCLAYAGCRAESPVRYCEYEGTLDLPDFIAGALWEFFQSL